MDDIGRILNGEIAAPGHSLLSDDDLLLVSDRVIVGKAPILFVFRDEPDEGDSGWVLLSGTEEDEELEDASRFEGKTVAWALELDPTLGAILGAAPDSSFERDSVGAEWVELEEG